jgi:steroid 5-alpha reductase family enzyme
MSKNTSQSKILSVAIPCILCIYTWATGYSNNQAPYIILQCAIISIAIHAVIGIPSIISRSERFYDFTGTISVWAMISLCYWTLPTTHIQTRGQSLAILCLIWTTRLGGFLLFRILKHKKDRRFDQLKKNPVSFLIAWEMSATWTVITILSALAALTSDKQAPLQSIDFLMIIGWIIAFAIETIADWQKYQFKYQQHKTPFICHGLFAYCRYPNYLGEILMWVFVAGIAWPNLSGSLYLSLISPIFVYILLTRVSGINLHEASNKKRFGHLKKYQSYCQKTPLLMPRLF